MITDEMIEAGRKTATTLYLADRADDRLWPDAISRIYTAMQQASRSDDRLRQQGQDEGFAAAVQWLRDRSAMKPPASLWHAASILADQLEQSRIPCTALEALTDKGGGE